MPPSLKRETMIPGISMRAKIVLENASTWWAESPTRELAICQPAKIIQRSAFTVSPLLAALFIASG